MEESTKKKLREFLVTKLNEFTDYGPLFDDESIFMSGRLDSFSMMNVVIHLEKIYGIINNAGTLESFSDASSLTFTTNASIGDNIYIVYDGANWYADIICVVNDGVIYN